MARELEHRRPEQRVEVHDVLPDEVVLLGRRAGLHPFVEVQTALGAQVLEAGVVTDRGVEPHVEVLARCAGDLEAEVRRVARDVPVGQRGFAVFAEPFLHLVGRFRLCETGHPLAQELLAALVRELEEIVRGRLANRRGARDHRVRVQQVGGRVGRAADFARVAVLVLRAALRAFALDEAVRQEHFLDRVIRLFDVARFDQALFLQGEIDALRQLAVLFRIRRVVVVERNVETVEVALVFRPHAIDQLLGREPFLFGAQHDRRAMRVVRPDVIHLMALHSHEPYPDVGLDVFDQVTDVNLAIGVRQCGCNENAAGHVD